jgi:dTDP-glucose pyrophosphorylase/CBS domain-containing protein
MNYLNVSDLFVSINTPIREVIEQIDRSGRISIALIVNEDKQLISTITDGDVRRGILAGLSLDEPVSGLLPIKALLPRPLPLTAPLNLDSSTLLQMMRENAVRQIPLVNDKDQVVDIVILRDLLSSQTPLQAVVMAGGKGTRLRPLTDNIPKPMLSVGDRPLMELTIEKLYNSGIRHVDVSTNYLAESIIEYFGNGSAFGVELNYIKEDRPLGTAGALGLMDTPGGTILVINGDVLTEVNFEAMLAYHQEQNSELTVGVRQYGMQVPYGVLECDGPNVRHLKEKPNLTFLVNAGIYLLEPSVYQYIPKDIRFDMTDLIQKLLDDNRPVMSYPIIEYWLDIGQPADYEQAQNDARDGKYHTSSKSDKKPD